MKSSSKTGITIEYTAANPGERKAEKTKEITEKSKSKKRKKLFFCNFLPSPKSKQRVGTQNDSPVKIEADLPLIPVWRRLAGRRVLVGFATFCWLATTLVFTFIRNPVFQSNEYTFPRDLIFAVAVFPSSPHF